MILDRGIYSDYLKLYYESFGYQVEIIPSMSEEILALGRENTNSKEYLTFTAMLGSVLAKSQKEKDSVQFLLPQNLGSEASGQYARVIYDFLKQKQLDQHSIVVYNEEKLYQDAKDLDALFRVFVAGDLAYLFKNKAMNHIPSWEEIMKSIHEIHCTKKKIAAIGEMDMLTVLDEGILDTLEQEYQVIRTPQAELFLFAWIDNGMNKKEAQKYISYLEQISDVLKDNSPYSHHFNQLLEIADNYLPKFSGDNGRYRYAKTVEISERVNAILMLSARYENTAMILEMRDIQNACKAPVYDIKLDHDFDENSWSKLKSFLYYCK